MTDSTSLQATAEALIDHHREELAAKDDIIRDQLNELEELREQLRKRDTSMLPPPSERETGPKGTLIELIDGIAVLSTTVETTGRMALETRKRVDEMPDLVKLAATEGASNAVIALVTRVEQLEHWRRQTDHACEACPNRVAL